MRERILTRRAALVAGAAASFVASAALLVIAMDVSSWRSEVTEGDIRYRVAPSASDLWEPATRMPVDAAAMVLGVDDDVEFRRAVRAIRLARLEDATVSDPELALRRNEAQARLEAIATSPGDSARRSRAAGLLGVLGLARLVSETQERNALLQSTVASLEFALALDPDNDEAKFNLELALQRGRGIQLTEGAGGVNPSPGGAGAKGAGAGEPGGGY